MMTENYANDAPSAALSMEVLRYAPYDWAPRIQCAGAWSPAEGSPHPNPGWVAPPHTLAWFHAVSIVSKATVCCRIK